jgi:nucleoside-diphosphate-sugar epimerase
MTISKASVKLIWNDHGTAGGNLVKDDYGKVIKYIKFIRHDLLDDKILTKVVKECDLVFHLAGNEYVRKGHLNTEVDFLNNIVATRNVLETKRDNEYVTFQG